MTCRCLGETEGKRGPRIYTDNKWHQFKYRYEVPKKILASEFDWLDEDDLDNFLKYKNTWYHLSVFERIPPGAEGEFSKWQGYHGDSYFSGVVIKVSEDGEEYKIGTYIS